MTADQKRVHLAVHGFRACVMGALVAGEAIMDYAWRLYVPDDRGQRNLTKMGVQRGQGRAWRIGYMSSNAVLYDQRELSDVPDDLLDSLDLSLIEQYLSTPH